MTSNGIANTPSRFHSAGRQGKMGEDGCGGGGVGGIVPCVSNKTVINIEQRTVQGETESEPVGSRTDTVARGNVGVLVGWIFIQSRVNLCKEVPMT